jgi:hypothetical protein
MRSLSSVSIVVLVGLLMAGLSGCGRRPQAPALRDTPVYHNAAEGFRFLVPDGWIQTASSLLPPGELQGVTFLVRYRVSSPEAGALLQIECTADSPDRDLQEYHAGPSYRVQRWVASEPPRDLDIHGVAARRLSYAATVDGRKMAKEVVCFPQRGRLYSFVGLFWATDDKARQQIRRAVESIIWEP